LFALLVLLGTWLSGPSRAAVATRHAVAAAPRKLSRAISASRLGPVVVRYTTALRVGIVALALIVLILWDNPSLTTVIVLAVIAVIMLLIVESTRAVASRSRPT
jgi:hypothetical protein